MAKSIWWKWLVLLPAAFGATLMGQTSAMAETVPLGSEASVSAAVPIAVSDLKIDGIPNLNPERTSTDSTNTHSTNTHSTNTHSTSIDGTNINSTRTEITASTPLSGAEMPTGMTMGMTTEMTTKMTTVASGQNAIEDGLQAAPATELQLAESSPSAAEIYGIRSTEPSASQNQGMSRLTLVNQLSGSQPTSQQNAMGQLTSVTQLTDVQPTDWAYQALQSLVKRYGCIVGYPDSTYRGQRALTRFEFAAGMNACLDRISELLAAATADLATKEDLATLQRLQEEFAAELAALRGRVDVLEARVSALEANQFSITTKLSGETLFYVADIFNEDDGFENETVFQYRNRLIFDTSFAGTDQLRARLQAGTLQPFRQPGNELGFGAFGNTDGDVVLDLLSYQFAVGDFARINLFANAGGLDDATFGNTINPLDNPARSAITRFGQRNAVYRTANTSAGAAINFFLTDSISLQAAYLAGESSDPSPGSGLFNGNYGALGQLTFRNIFDRVDLAFTYVNAYTGTSTNADGSITAGVPFGLGSRSARVDVDRPVIANSYGIEANLKLFPGFQLGGWVGYSAIRAIGLGDADVWNYAGTLAFPDLFKRGSLGGIIFGMQPRLTGSDASIGNRLGQRKDPDVGFHLEAFYRYALNDNIDITPGFIWITAPNHNEDNNDEFMGVIRTTFRF
jgi:hypothetical protein